MEATEISTWKCSPLVKEYLLEQDKYEKKYGKNTIVLMQVGSFFEFYGVNTDVVNYKSIDESLDLDNSHLYTTAKILGFSIAKKTNNVLMAGSPIYCVEKHVKKLLDNNYTVIIIEQIGDDKKDVERKITNIYSPGTYLEDLNSNKNNYLMSIYIDNTETLTGNMLEIGVSCIDLSIGKNIIYEIPYKKEDKNYIHDELYKFVNSYNPNELIIYMNNVSEKEEKNIIENLEINQRIIKKVNYDSNYRKIEVQELMLKEIFSPKVMINVFEYLNIERLQIGSMSYIHLLLFIKEHDNSKLINLEKPVIYSNDEILNLNKNTIYRLNIVENNTQENNTSVKSLFNIVDMTSTNIGKRTLKNRLLFPITNINKLNERYDLAEYFINNPEILKGMKSELKNISDLERLNRKLSTYKLDKDSDLLQLYTSLNYIKSVVNLIDTNLLKLLNVEDDLMNHFDDFYNKLTNVFNIDNLYKRKNNIFNNGFNDKIDELDSIYIKNKWIMLELCKKFTDCIKEEDKKVYEKDNLLVEYEWSERDMCYNIYTTEARVKKLKASLLKKKTIKIKNDKYDLDIVIKSDSLNYKSSAAGGKTKIKSDLILQFSEDLYKSKNKLENEVKTVYKKVLEDLYEYHSVMNNIIDLIGNMDCGLSSASNHIKYNYSKPKLDNSNCKSYIDCKDIRHPIIERILTNNLYVPNDVKMGKDTKDGMLLFGTNASGKSCLMKSIGLVVIMAQAGLYVPCSNLEMKPYTNIFSRIGNQDNIFTGKSSFTQEMSELRDIFNRVNENSLILGDEPCSGTEHISAISIVSSSIKLLCDKMSSFIFATHLHKLSEISLIKNLENLHMYHLKIKYDDMNDRLIYDRKLEVGMGNEEYGLEVAKSLSLGREFINDAFVVKNELKNIGLYSTKGSTYNQKKIIDKCEICNSNENCEIHHIQFQCFANSYGHINNIHKNNIGNLCNLCTKCHDKVHNDEIHVYGYMETSEGKFLNYKLIDKKSEKITKKKYDEIDINWIKECYENKNMSYKDVSESFKHFRKKTISPTIVSKILKNKY